MRFIERLCWVFFVLCAFFACLWLLLQGIRAAGWKEPEAAVWAAWAQAIGSIAAIAAAIYILDRQNRNAERLRRRMEDMAVLRKYAGIAAIVDHANDLIQQSREGICNVHLRPGFLTESYSSLAFHDVERALLAIPLHDLGSYQMVVGVREMCDVVRAVKTIASDVSYDPDGCMTIHGAAQRSLIALAEQSAEAHVKVRKSIAAMGWTEDTRY